METIKDFLESIVDSYKDRIKSPLIGSFMISFMIFNWRAFAILIFSDWPIHTRIKWVEEHYSENKNFVWPILISFFYVLILPYINLFFDWLLSMYTNKRMLKINYKRNSELVRRKVEAVLLREIADAEAGTSEINSLKERIEGLQLENNAMIQQNQDDLNRHNTTLENFKMIESNHKRNIDSLTKQRNLLLASRSLPLSDIITSKEIKEAVEEADGLSEFGRKDLIDFFTKLENGKAPDVNVDSIQKYEKQGYIEVIAVDNYRKMQLTVLGQLMQFYLVNNLDLM